MCEPFMFSFIFSRDEIKCDLTDKTINNAIEGKQKPFLPVSKPCDKDCFWGLLIINVELRILRLRERNLSCVNLSQADAGTVKGN